MLKSHESFNPNSFQARRKFLVERLSQIFGAEPTHQSPVLKGLIKNLKGFEELKLIAIYKKKRVALGLYSVLKGLLSEILVISLLLLNDRWTQPPRPSQLTRS